MTTREFKSRYGVLSPQGRNVISLALKHFSDGSAEHAGPAYAINISGAPVAFNDPAAVAWGWEGILRKLDDEASNEVRFYWNERYKVPIIVWDAVRPGDVQPALEAMLEELK